MSAVSKDPETLLGRNMNKVAITLSGLALTTALAGACSKSDSTDGPPLVDGTGGSGGGSRPDAGKEPVEDGGDIEEDGGITDAQDELVPTDASRGEDSGDASDGDDEADAPVEPECIFDSDCADKVTIGACEQARCVDQKCTKGPAKAGTLCDDGEVCTLGDVCDGDGTCAPGYWDDQNAACVAALAPGAVQVTEIMGKPRAIPGKVDPEKAQYIEITSRLTKAVSLSGLSLVYYEWPKDAEEPSAPTGAKVHRFGDEHVLMPGKSVLLLRSSDRFANGDLPGLATYEGIDFSEDQNARLMLGRLARGTERERDSVTFEILVDSVYIPAGTFSEANQGRSWQAGAPLPAADGPDERVFCHTPAQASNAYVEDGELKNYGTPGTTNASCAP